MYVVKNQFSASFFFFFEIRKEKLNQFPLSYNNVWHNPTQIIFKLVDVTHLFYISEIANFCIQFPAIDELNDLIQSLRWNEFWTCQNGLNWGDNTTMNIQILTLKIDQSM